MSPLKGLNILCGVTFYKHVAATRLTILSHRSLVSLIPYVKSQRLNRGSLSFPFFDLVSMRSVHVSILL